MLHERRTYPRQEVLAEPDWLEQHLDDPGIRVIDCDRPEMRTDRPHIPGAVLLPIHPYFRDIQTGEGVATPEQTEQIMRTLGVNNDTLVILYDSEGGLLATRVWWVLWYYGHENAAVLNGGWPAWIASRRPTTRRHWQVDEGDFTIKGIHEDRIASCDVILGGLETDIVPLDVRSDEEWTGEKPAPNETNKKEGRIPGAIHVEWREFVDWNNATRFKPADAIEQILEQAGVPRDKKIVPY